MSLAVGALAWWGSGRDELHLGAAPFLGGWDARLVPSLLLPALVAMAVVVGAGQAHRLSWRALLWAAVVASALWSVSLAAVDGWHRLAEPLRSPHDYLAAVPEVGSPGGFLDRFVDDIDGFPTHVRSHPPGMVLVLWSLGRAGLDGAGAAAALVIGAGASAVVAVLVTVRRLAGEGAARRAAPFLVLAPWALWVATSADALFLAVSAWAVALLVIATGASGRPSRVAACLGGAAVGAAMLLSYGVVLVMLVPAAVIAWRRRFDIVPWAVAPVIGVLLGAGAAGFWWWDGLDATREQYWAGVASERPFSYFVVSNLVVAAVAVGPAAVGGVAQMTWRSALGLLVGAGLAALLLADASALSKGEVERIWLPFFPYVTVAAAALPAAERWRWLAASALMAIAGQALLRSPW